MKFEAYQSRSAAECKRQGLGERIEPGQENLRRVPRSRRDPCCRQTGSGTCRRGCPRREPMRRPVCVPVGAVGPPARSALRRTCQDRGPETRLSTRTATPLNGGRAAEISRCSCGPSARFAASSMPDHSRGRSPAGPCPVSQAQSRARWAGRSPAVPDSLASWTSAALASAAEQYRCRTSCPTPVSLTEADQHPRPLL